MKTIMFPGQGSQSKGMGAELFDQHKELVDQADDVLGYSIRELCVNDPDNKLGNTQYTQPALYVVSALSYYDAIQNGESRPDFLIGHSLGEYNALLAAECFSFVTGLELVRRRGQIMSEAKEGGMAAIINASRTQIESILDKNNLNNIDLANFNTPSQIVISGKKEEIVEAQKYFQEGRMMYFPLNTSGAFHSRFMQPASDQFKEFLQEHDFNAPKIPVLANTSAKPYVHENIVETLANQIASPVLWSETVQYLLELGSSTGEMAFKELGHGDVLSNLVAKIKRESKSSEKKAAANGATNGKHYATKNLTNGKVNGASLEGSVDLQNKPQAKEQEVKSNSKNQATNGTPKNVEDKVATWNSQYPVGTKVQSLLSDYDELVTRTEAVVLFGHRAAVYMQDHKGYFDLDEIKPV